MRPKLSVVIPTFNSKTYVVECVASALNQTYSNIEVIVDDNTSRDGTPELLESVFSGDPRFKLFKNKEDLNIPHGWNRGMLRAEGEYLLLLHSDNLLHPQYAEMLAQVSEKFQSEVIYTENLYFENETPKGLFTDMDKAHLPVTYMSPGSRAVDYIFRYQRMIPTSSVAIHRKCLEDRPPFDPRFLWDPDIELMTWLATHFSVTHVNHSFAAIRTHDGQAASWKDPTFVDQYRNLLQYANEAGNSGMHQFLLHWSWSNQDICDKLKDLKQVPFKSYWKYQKNWMSAEWALFRHFAVHFARKVRLMGRFFYACIATRLRQANP